MKVPQSYGYTGTIAAIWEAFRNAHERAMLCASYARRYGSPVRYVGKEHSLIPIHSLRRAHTHPCVCTHDDKFDERAAEVEIPLACCSCVMYAKDVTSHTYSSTV